MNTCTRDIISWPRSRLRSFVFIQLDYPSLSVISSTLSRFSPVNPNFVSCTTLVPKMGITNRHPAFAQPVLVQAQRYRRQIDTYRPPNRLTKRPMRSRLPSSPRMTASDRSTDSLPIPLAPQTSDVWELDFYSRPVVGLDGKKLWELIITDTTGAFNHIEAIPNSMVNSRELRKRIQAVIEDAPTRPRTIRFFRIQMFNMINIALSEIDVQVSPSRKTYALFQLLKEREETVYVNMPGFQKSLTSQANVFAGIDLVVTQRLPDALRCESFAFGSFPLGQLEEFFDSANPTDFFGDRCLVDPNILKDTMVPGMIVFSKRAYPLAAWISGIELAFIRATMEKQEIVFECGLSTVYKFAQITDDIRDEARRFQTARKDTGGLHFLAVQTNADAEEIDGMWLLCET